MNKRDIRLLGIVGLLVFALSPLLLANVPPLLDYPNHLARGVALTAQGSDLPAAKIYESDWGIIPNLGGDVILVVLLQFLPPLAAGRLFIGLVVAIVVGGIAFYARTAFGRWTAWSLVGPVAAYNGLFLMGFLNFTLGSGLALGVAALWTAQRRVQPRSAVACAAIGIVIVWFCHLAAAFFCIMLITAREVTSVGKRPFPEMLREMLRRLPALILVCVPAILLYVASDFPAAQTSAAWSWHEKQYRLLTPIAAYFPLVDVVVTLVLVATLLLSALARRLEIDWAGALTLLVCLVAFVAAPLSAKGGHYIDGRFATMAWLLFFACLAPSLKRVWRQAMIVGALSALALKITSVSVAWVQAQSDIAAVRSALACVPPLSRVLVARGDDWEPSTLAILSPTWFWYPPAGIKRVPLYNHLGAFALIDRGAFWPNMFAVKGQQPIVVRPPYDIIARRISVPPMLNNLLEQTNASDGYLKINSYAAGFDFILLLDDRDFEVPPDPALRIECDAGYAKLLRILTSGPPMPAQQRGSER